MVAKLRNGSTTSVSFLAPSSQPAFYRGKGVWGVRKGSSSVILNRLVSGWIAPRKGR